MISLFGCITLGYLIWMIYSCFAYPAVGGYVTSAVLEFFLSVIVAGVVIFYAAKYIRAKQGIDLKYVYNRIPPE